MSTRVKTFLAVLISMSTLVSIAVPAPTTDTPRASSDDKRSALLVELGKRLFVDTRLSADSKVSCATCHVPEKGLSDGLPVAVGIGGQRGNRNTPSLWNVSLLPTQFWDGRRSTLEEQALDPLLNPREHGMRDSSAILAVIHNDHDYRSAFAASFGVSVSDVNLTHLATAIAAFERTLISDDSAFDRYLYMKSPKAMSDAATRGLSLFRGRAACATCHTIGETRASLTDHQFHSLGISLESVAPRLAEITQRVAAVDRRELDQLITADADVATLGRFSVTKDPRDIGKFRTPSLRNVALTPPYMHDGSVPTLEAAIDSEIYYRSLEQGRPLILTPTEKADLIAFLDALTSRNAMSDPTMP